MKGKSWAIVIGTVAVVIVFVILRSEATKNLPQVRNSSSMTPQDDKVELDESSCTIAGGTWNACGSACRTDPDAVCIELCVEYCECKGDSECPSGYACGDFVDGVGVCRKQL